MTPIQTKLSLYKFPTPALRQQALYLLRQVGNIEKQQIVFDRWGGVSLIEVKR